ncbi:hypothetical protein [Paenibacillus sp. 2KB_22]|uniref:hypothetical protein n=1 Tax=Paenibacillus sp. 2KB_22 TaxID=3232978 RepID=UPI003F9AD51A
MIIKKCRGAKTLCHFQFENDLSGDEIESVRSGSLTTYAFNKVAAGELLLTLAHPVTDSIGSHDVVENITWTPFRILQ